MGGCLLINNLSLCLIAERLQLRQSPDNRAVRDDQERNPRGESDQVVYARPDRSKGAGHDP